MCDIVTYSCRHQTRRCLHVQQSWPIPDYTLTAVASNPGLGRVAVTDPYHGMRRPCLQRDTRISLKSMASPYANAAMDKEQEEDL